MSARASEREWYRLNAHRRLLLSLAVAGAVAFLTPETLRIPVRLAFSWDVGVIAFLAMTLRVVRICPAHRMRETVLANDQGRLGVLLLVLLSTAASLAAIFFLLQKAKGSDAAVPAI